MLTLYRYLSLLFSPALFLLSVLRCFRGKEVWARVGERFGYASLARPSGRLFWCHAASVGELQAAFALIHVTERVFKEQTFWLVTTGTKSSASVFEATYACSKTGGLHTYIHQFVPWDVPQAVSRFLKHWQPDGVLWLESEIWPNFLTEIHKKELPAVLVNARLSERSFAAWSKRQHLFQCLLATFDQVFAGSPEDKDRLYSLGIKADYLGNLKYARHPEPNDINVTEQMQLVMQDRPSWIAASIHPPEFVNVCAAHKKICKSYRQALLIAAPRHPEKSSELQAAATKSGLSTVRLSHIESYETLTDPMKCPEILNSDCLIVDRIGLMDTVYRRSSIVFVGGSFFPHGGQNPLEPAALKSAILHGPYVENFRYIYNQLNAVDGAAQVTSCNELAQKIMTLLLEPSTTQHMIKAASQVAQTGQDIALRHAEAFSRVLQQKDQYQTQISKPQKAKPDGGRL